MKKQFISSSSRETQKRGEEFAREIIEKDSSQKAFFVGLRGELGGGKTTFLQGFSQGLGIEENILSPTFTIMKKFEIPFPGFKSFYHIDCYRIKKAGEIFKIGFKDFISVPGNIIAVEWVERIKKILPRETILVDFEFLNKNERKITIFKKNEKE